MGVAGISVARSSSSSIASTKRILHGAVERRFGDGALTWSAVRELTRVAIPETEQAWLDVAQGKTIRQLEELVAAKHPGAAPDTPPDPSARRHVLRFEVTAETFALFREALAQLRRRTGSSLDDDAALFEMARCVLVGPSDAGRSGYQIALTVCAACQAGKQDANGDVVHVGGPQTMPRAARPRGLMIRHISPEIWAEPTLRTTARRVGALRSPGVTALKRLE